MLEDVKAACPESHQLMIHIEDIKGIVCIFLKWGCMRYLSIVSILSTVDLGRHTPSLEKQAGVPAWKLSNVLLCKLYFSHLKIFLKSNISLSVRYIQNISTTFFAVSPFLWHYVFLNVQLPYSYACFALLLRRRSAVRVRKCCCSVILTVFFSNGDNNLLFYHTVISIFTKKRRQKHKIKKSIPWKLCGR